MYFGENKILFKSNRFEVWFKYRGQGGLCYLQSTLVPFLNSLVHPLFYVSVLFSVLSTSLGSISFQTNEHMKVHQLVGREEPPPPPKTSQFLLEYHHHQHHHHKDTEWPKLCQRIVTQHSSIQPTSTIIITTNELTTSTSF